MKKKTINAVICKKFDEFVKSITDSAVQALVKKNSIITGGCITSMLLGEKVNDFDIYFTNKETVKAVAEYYVMQFNSANGADGYVLDGDIPNPRNIDQLGGAALNMTPDRIKIVFDSSGVAKEKGFLDPHEEGERSDAAEQIADDNKRKYRPVYLSCNAITLSDQIQLVIRFYGGPTEIHDNYDFMHCTNYWFSKGREVVLNQPALESILAKDLKYVGSKYPVASIIRTRKFINRGWTITAGQYLKMCFQISLLNLTDVSVLEDQLVGVDVAYFGMLITALQNAPIGQELSYDYIAEIIDRIF
jgi:hypothetical protein